LNVFSCRLFAQSEQSIRHCHLYLIVDDVYSIRTGASLIGKREQDMKIRDSIFATIALALGTLAMAGVVGSGAYAQAAGAEARGVDALSSVMAQSLCNDTATLAAVSPGVAP
jgi:hypothetical protein